MGPRSRGDKVESTWLTTNNFRRHAIDWVEEFCQSRQWGRPNVEAGVLLCDCLRILTFRERRLFFRGEFAPQRSRAGNVR